MSFKKKLINLFPNLYFTYSKIFHSQSISDVKKVAATKSKYLKKFGVSLDLDEPKTFYEKINYLKLYYYNSNAHTLVDKYEVKQFLSSNGYESHIVKTIDHFSSLSDLKNFLICHKQSKFVIKFSHIGGIFFWNNGKIRDKKGYKVSKRYMFAFIKEILQTDYYYHEFEWPYKGLKKQIIIEDYLPSNNDDGLTEFKFFCNYGSVKMINVVSGRQNDVMLKEAFTDENLVKFNVHQNQKTFLQSELIKPICFDEMLEFSRQFSKEYPILRVDLLCDGKTFYFCEFTFFDCAGFNYFYPASSNLEIGNLFNLKNLKI